MDDELRDKLAAIERKLEALMEAQASEDFQLLDEEDAPEEITVKLPENAIPRKLSLDLVMMGGSRPRSVLSVDLSLLGGSRPRGGGGTESK